MMGGDEPHGADPEDTASHVERTMEQVNKIGNVFRPPRPHPLACAPFVDGSLAERAQYWKRDGPAVCWFLFLVIP